MDSQYEEQSLCSPVGLGLQWHSTKAMLGKEKAEAAKLRKIIEEVLHSNL